MTMTLPWAQREDDDSRSIYSLPTLTPIWTATSSRMDTTCYEESTVGIQPPQAPTESSAAVSSASSNGRVDSRDKSICTSVMVFLYWAMMIILGIFVVMVLGYVVGLGIFPSSKS